MTEDTTVALRIMSIAELRARAAAPGSVLRNEWDNIASACRMILKAPADDLTAHAKAGEVGPRRHLRLVGAPVDDPHIDV